MPTLSVFSCSYTFVLPMLLFVAPVTVYIAFSWISFFKTHFFFGFASISFSSFFSSLITLLLNHDSSSVFCIKPTFASFISFLADKAELKSAFTSDWVAPLCFFDWSSTLWTVLDILEIHTVQFLLLAHLIFLASQPYVWFHFAVHTVESLALITFYFRKV